MVVEKIVGRQKEQPHNRHTGLVAATDEKNSVYKVKLKYITKQNNNRI
jgi:hypothetical protein